MNISDITEIIKLVVELLVVVISTFLIPWIKEKTDAQKRQKVLEYVDIAVGCAEQIAQAEGFDGEKKKAWVIEYLESLGLSIDYDEVDAIIENAVLKLHSAMKS